MVSRFIYWLCITISFLLCTPAFADAGKSALPPFDKLLTKTTEWGYKLAPNGKSVAYIEEKRTVNHLNIADLASLKIIKSINLGGRYGTNLVWINNRELAFEAGGVIVAINTQGEDRRILINHVYDHDADKKEDREYRDWHIFSTLDDDDEHILVSSKSERTEWNWTGIHKINIYTGEKQDLHDGTKLGLASWYNDAFGNMRGGKKKDGNSFSSFLLQSEEGKPVLKPLGGKKSGLDFSTKNDSFLTTNARVCSFSSKDQLVYVEERITGDRFKLISYDPIEDRIVDVIFEDSRYDIDAGLRFDSKTKELVGLTMLLDKRTSVWFDKTMQQFQKKLDTSNPDTINNVFQWTDNFEYLLVQRTNSKGVDKIDVYSTKDNVLTTLSNRGLDPSEYKLGETRTISYKARDGFSLEGFLTIPPDADLKKPLPVIVMPVEDPWSRYIIGFGSTDQFFATRGYGVFRPNPRGSSSYGKKYLGLDTQNLLTLMQDDIADGVRELIKNGTADAGRIFLFGEYYGGYRALLSAMSYPDLYKGVVSRNAILDLPEQYKFMKDRGYYDGDLDFWNTSLHSQKPPKKLLEQYSPQHLIKNIKTPVLVFHAKNNNVVDAKQAENFRDTAAKIDNKNITVTLIERESHSNWDTSNEIYFLEKSLVFFGQYGTEKAP